LFEVKIGVTLIFAEANTYASFGFSMFLRFHVISLYGMCGHRIGPDAHYVYYDDCIITRSPAVARIADSTICLWPSRSSKADDFHFIWKPIWDFLSMINSKLGPVSQHLTAIVRNGLQGHLKLMIFI